MPIMRLMFSLLGRGVRRPERSARFRPQLTALENRWVPSTITEFALPPLSLGGSFGAAALTRGPDGNVWFSDPHAGAVGRITPDGQVTEFATPGIAAAAITAGSDGNLWFLNDSLTESGSDAIGRITPAGQVTTFTLPDDFTQPSQITAGPDGNVWFTENIYPTGEKVGRITPAGQITEFTVPVPPGVVIEAASARLSGGDMRIRSTSTMRIRCGAPNAGRLVLNSGPLRARGITRVPASVRAAGRPRGVGGCGRC
jgi:hypothetical protein